MSFTQQLHYEALRSIDSATFTGSYQTLGTPLQNSASLIKLVNNSTSLVTISVDGINDYDILPPSSFTIYDVTTNHANDYVFAKQGRQYSVKGSTGTGSVYLVVQYIGVR